MKTVTNYSRVLDEADAGPLTLPEAVTVARHALMRLDEAATAHTAPDGAQVRRDFVGARRTAKRPGGDPLSAHIQRPWARAIAVQRPENLSRDIRHDDPEKT